MTFFLFIAWTLMYWDDNAPSLPAWIIFFCALASAYS